MKYDYLIVGAGFSGSVLAERIANKLNKKVLLIDQRDHIGGNCYDYLDDNGILVHKYGPHIFHTQSKKVWDYISNFSEWHYYYHKVLAFVEGKNVPVPFNFNSLYSLFPPNYAEKLEELLINKFGYGLKIPILKLRETENSELKFLADYIYDNIFHGYTTKQWGLKPESLDFSVTSRVPVYLSRDDRYFQDKYQGIPKEGYTSIFKKLLNSKNIDLGLNTKFEQIEKSGSFNEIIYTGNIDNFFNFLHGRLPYRSLNFDFQSVSTDFYQEVAQVNYPNNHDFTRITEFKHFLCQKSEKSTIAVEYPTEYIHGINEPYYPIPEEQNHELYEKYKSIAAKLNNVHFVGRLADYKYYNMDQIIGVALLYFEKNIAGRK